tara:strand:- start:638 stop:2149 length:1512 start_codon:yes stop_codon:yes gene_type:complete
MEILWKEHGMTKANARTTLDEIISKIGKQKSTSFGMSKVDLKQALKTWGENFGGNPMIFWTDNDIRKPELNMQARELGTIATTRKKPKIEDTSFMIDALHQIKNSDNKEIIDKIITYLSTERTGRQKIIPERDRDKYTKTGKKDETEIREYTTQEQTLSKLLTNIEKGYNYKKDNVLLRELIENKVLSSHYLSLVSRDLFSENTTKKIHPRLIDKLRQPNIYKAFMEYLKSKGKNLPRASAMHSALKVLSGKKAGGQRIINILLDKPEEYRFKEDLYDNHLKIINSYITKNIENLHNTLEPLRVDGQYNWTDFLNTVRDKYNSKKLTIEEFEGKEIVKLVKEILEDIEDLQRAQKAKVKLIEIGQSNGKSGTVNSDEYDDTMARIEILKQTYYFNKHMDEAQRKTNDSAPGKLKRKKAKPREFIVSGNEVKPAPPPLKPQIILRYREIKRLLNDVKRERNIKTDSDVDSMLNVSRDKEISRYTNTLRTIREQFPDIDFGDEEE